MRLERFKNVVIPVDGIMYAQYASDDRKDASSKFMEPNTTRIYFFSPNAPEIVRNVTLEGDCLDEFNEWYSKFNIGNSPTYSTAHSNSSSSIEPVLKFSRGTQTGYSNVADSPMHTLTITHTDGSTETTVLDGGSTNAPAIDCPD